MSNYDGSLSTQPDWQGHYSFLPPGEGGIFGQPFEQVTNSTDDNDAASQPRSSNTRDNNLDTHGQASSSALSSPTSHHRALDPLGLRQPKAEPTTQEEPDIPGTGYTVKVGAIHEEPLASSEAPHARLEANPPIPAPSTEQNPRGRLSIGGNEEMIVEKDEDDEVVDDDDMVEGDGDGDGEGGGEDTPNHPQTAAERTAARRKMKRFR